MSNILTPLHGADATSDADKAGATKRRRSLPSTARFEIDRGSAPLAVAFDLGTLEWKQHRSSKGKAGTQPVPKGCTLAAALAMCGFNATHISFEGSFLGILAAFDKAGTTETYVGEGKGAIDGWWYAHYFTILHPISF